MVRETAGLPWAWASALRVAAHQQGFLPTVQLPHPAVSVGALEMGGTGKTPVTLAVASALAAAGARPAILSRGYGRASDAPVLVSDGAGNKPLVSATEGGDEPWLMAHLLPEVPVAVASRREQAADLVRNIDTFVMDDAFQHVRVNRDTNVLVVDGAAPFWRQHTPPFGRLRERPAAAARATVFAVYGDASGLETRWPAIPRLTVGVRPPRFVLFEEWLADGRNVGEPSPPGGSVAAFAGIARPHRFFDGLKDTGAAIGHTRVFRDHHPYRTADIKQLLSDAEQQGCRNVVTTEKDAARLAELAVPATRLHVMTHRVDLEPHADLLAICGVRQP
ncbi:MAG: tetraacyldisaccharide 4'-kinase [Acidobacteria bacterium]|nr:tetraacyldisaccharide 4'-kinase [Acidobacteriota bacterium]